MEAKFIFILVSFLFLISTVSAQLTISEPKDIYNLGEKLYVSLEGIRGSDQGNLNVDLVCGDNTINLLKISARAFSKEQDQYYSLPYKTLTKKDLEIENLNDLLGECKLLVNINILEAKTKTFTITNRLNSNILLNKNKYNPGEEIVVDLKVTKLNGEVLNGYYEMTGIVSDYGEINQGSAQITVFIDEKQKSDNYNLEIKVYDLEEENNILNQDLIIEKIYINQKPTKFEISVSDSQINPGEDVIIYPTLLDQTGKEISGEVLITLESPSKEAKSHTINTNEFFNLNTQNNFTSGNWKIYGAFEDLLSEETNFIINSVPLLNYSFEEGNLIIKNIGNSLYNDVLNISIEEKEEQIKVNLKQGESKKYILSAPNGEYNIQLNSNSGDSFIKNSVFLTGNAINIRGEGESAWTNYTLFWIIIIVIIIITIIYIRYKTSKGGNSIRKTPKNKKNKKNKKLSLEKIKSFFIIKPNPKKQTKKQNNKGVINLTPNSTSYFAKSSLVLNAEKIMTTIITLNIKNMEMLTNETKEKINQIIQETTENKVALEIKQNYINLLISPLITKTFKNESFGVNVSLKLLKAFDEFNKKYNEKIDFGIGLHCGDLVSLKNKTDLEYTNIEDTITLAQKASNFSKQNVLLSSKIRRKILSEIKKEQKLTFQGKDFYKLEELKNKEKNQAKLKDLLNRI